MTIKRLLVAILAVVVLLQLAVSTSANGSISTESMTSTVIDDILLTAMNAVGSTERIPVMIWIAESDMTEAYATVEREVGTKVEQLIADATNALKACSFGEIAVLEQISEKDVNSIVAAKREAYADVQHIENTQFIGRCLTDIIQTERAVATEDTTYICKYAPCVIAEFTKAELLEIAKDSEVDRISYIPSMRLQNSMDVSVPAVRATFEPTSLYYGYTGEGVAVGMIEEGLPDIAETAFDGADISVYNYNSGWDAYTDEYKEVVVEHANSVASIMVSQDNEKRGIVPDAKLVCASVGNSVDYIEAVEFLIGSNNNISVINMSANFSRTLDKSAGLEEDLITAYLEDTVLDNWTNHIAVEHSVHFVVSAGNMRTIPVEFSDFYYNDTLHTEVPARAENVIAVGNINDNNSSNHLTYTLNSSSKYVDAAGFVNKPDIVAPGTNISTPFGTLSGTSFSAPHVSATIALLIDAVPSLATLQDAVKAILAAGISSNVISYDSRDTVNFDKCGAGLLDAQGALYTATGMRWRNGYYDVNQSSYPERRYTVTVTESDDVFRVALTWLRQASMNHNGGTLTSQNLAQLNMHIIYPMADGSSDVVSITYANSISNLLVYEFSDPVPGQYTIIIEPLIPSPLSKRVYYGLAWY